MAQWWNDSITRRNLLRLGLTSAALAAMPWSLARRAGATAADPHLIVTFFGDGGWDPTQTLEVHDPADTTDGIDVDVPGQPVSALRTVGAITYTSNPTLRPMVDTFFDHWPAAVRRSTASARARPPTIRAGSSCSPAISTPPAPTSP